jgi:hypothetical protein
MCEGRRRVPTKSCIQPPTHKIGLYLPGAAASTHQPPSTHLHLEVEDLGLAGGGGGDEVVVQQLQDAAANVLQLLLHLQRGGRGRRGTGARQAG